ncbi:Deoxyribonuclease-1 [Channa argus]|uniref:Deoxyribonuclease-1 n=1 Tax=Channa argus TaxID=215402 RepID=A0A6G1PJD8_CHAAH|nr:Deoxyribonuclease-1 [Channa argus]
MKVAAFNVKNFGMKKVMDDTVRKNLIKIVSRYSVLVMLEVKDLRAVKKFLKELNNYGDNKSNPFDMRCSKPLGRRAHRELFAFFYRQEEVSVSEQYQYEEGNEDVFAREPFILKFKCPKAAVKDLILIPVHTSPEDTETELGALDEVVKAVRTQWRTRKIMILGDFNASGPYLSMKRKKRLRLSSSPYHWLIEDHVDTTTSNLNDHTYDRIVVFGKWMVKAVVAGSAKPFNFQAAYRLSDAKAKAISDHYPVEVELRSK